MKLLKPMIKMAAPGLAKNLTSKIEVLLDDTAEQNNVPPFELSLHVSKKDNEAEGNIYIKTSGLQRLLRAIDVQSMVNDLFQEQFKTLPAIIQKQVTKMMGGSSLDFLLLQLLDQGDLVAQYDEEDELQFYQVVEGQPMKQIDLEDFFTSL